jgi:hypothetical protein
MFFISIIFNSCPIARGKWKRHPTCPIGQVKMILWYVQFLKSKMINIELFSVGSHGEFYLNTLVHITMGGGRGAYQLHYVYNESSMYHNVLLIIHTKRSLIQYTVHPCFTDKMINIELFSVGSHGEFYLNIASYVSCILCHFVLFCWLRNSPFSNKDRVFWS